MNYVLATKHDIIKWYVYQQPITEGQFELIEQLDLKKVTVWGNKESAKVAAIALGLKTWRYIGL